MSINLGPLHGSNVKETIDLPEPLRCLEDGEEVPKGHGLFRILTPSKGDEKVVWDCRDLGAIQKAKKTFNELKEKGMIAYKVGLDGKKTSTVLEEFDPFAEEIVFVPVRAAVGG